MMKGIRLDFIIHWLWAIVFAILLISGISLMGAKFGWILQYNLALADYLHRTMAALWLILTIIAIGIEIQRYAKGEKEKQSWLIINKTGLGIYVLISTILFTISGIFLWVCTDYSHTIIAFSLIIHELLTFLSVPVILWHVYDKAYALPHDIGGNKSA